LKAKFTLRALKFTIYCIAILLQISLEAQTPIFKFKNPTLVSGTAGQVNATYRFPNVAPGTDARVKIIAKTSGMTLVSIDRTIDGYSEAFQPEYTIAANKQNGYIDFQVVFVKPNSSVPNSQFTVDVSGLDIDGTEYLNMNLREFNRIDMGGGSCTFNLDENELAITEVGTGFQAENVTGTLYGTLVDTSATQVMYSVRSHYVDTFYFRVGAHNGLPVAMSRYASLYFKRFTFPTMGSLSITNLESFKGVEQDEKIKLNWDLKIGNTAAEVILERNENGNSFREIARYWVNMEGNNERSFSYVDPRSGSASFGYRLKITDANGKIGYTNVLYFKDKQVQETNLDVYPSITNSSVAVSCVAPNRQSGSLLIVDMSGRIVKTEKVILEKGNNNFRLSGFDLLRKANYLVVLTTDEMKYSRQVIVQ
jgi:hypothetical protein